jgi:hypothetical protein
METTSYLLGVLMRGVEAGDAGSLAFFSGPGPAAPKVSG